MAKSTRDADFIATLQEQAKSSEGKPAFQIAKLHMTQPKPSSGKSFDEILLEEEMGQHLREEHGEGDGVAMAEARSQSQDPPSREASGPSESASNIPVSAIDPSPYQPRIKIDEDALRELGESIEAIGLINPIVVRPKGDRYELVGGERRWRAHILIGRDTIEAFVREMSDSQAAVKALADNDAREDLTDFERAIKYQALLSNGDAASQIDLARKIGRDRIFVVRCLSMFRLPQEVIDMLQNRPEFLTARSAADFAAFVEKDVDLVIEACRKIYHGDLDATNALNWLKGQSRARHSPVMGKPIKAWEREGRQLGLIKCEGRKVVITCASGISPNDIIKLLIDASVPIGTDKGKG